MRPLARALAVDAVDAAPSSSSPSPDAVVRRGRALLGAYLNGDPDNQVYVFMFAFSVLLFSVPPLLKLKHVLYPPEVEPEAWDYEAEIADLAPGGARRRQRADADAPPYSHARRSGAARPLARVARRETSTRPFVDGADDDGRRRERTRETRARIDREARARERRSGREDARARAPEIAHRTRIAMRANATHAARARAFSAYRFGTVEDVETLPMYRRKDDHDNGKYRASATTRALARARRAISRGERVGWLGLLALIFVGRTVFDGKENRVPSAMGVMPVMRRSVVERKTPAQVDGVDELVVVPGHAVYYGNNFLEAKDESNWALEPHQLLEGEAKAFMEHMERGVRELAKNPRAMLVFSGGKTRREAGAISEASSYWQVSRAFDWFGVDAGVELRSFTEEHARDSFENLLFSVCRFFELTRKFPSKITVVGFESKRDRFQKLHLRAIGYPESNFTYIGTKALNEKEMEAGEVKVREAFARDPFGCRGALAAKRHDRDPFNEGAPYSSQVKILSAFWLHIDTCSQRLYNGYFPWSPGMMIK